MAVKAAGDATGPVALPTDSALPQSCQAYVRAVQACINRSGGSDVLARNRVQTLRRALQTHRMQTWPGWKQSDYLERGCVQQTEGLSTMTEGC